MNVFKLHLFYLLSPSVSLVSYPNSDKREQSVCEITEESSSLMSVWLNLPGFDELGQIH